MVRVGRASALMQNDVNIHGCCQKSLEGGGGENNAEQQLEHFGRGGATGL